MFHVREADKCIRTLKERVAWLIQESETLRNSPLMASSYLVVMTEKLSKKVASDNTINSFLKFSNEPGMEALANELAIKVRSKGKGLLREIEELEESYHKVGINRVYARNPNMGQMGFSLSEMFSSGDQSAIDRSTGLRILQAYFDAARSYSGFLYSDFNSFVADLDRKQGGDDFALSIGEVVKNMYRTTDEDEASNRMIALADKTQGRATTVQMIQSAGGAGVDTTLNLTSAIMDVSAASAQDLAEVASDVGSGLLSTAKVMKYLPWIIGGVALVLIIVYGSKGMSAYARIKHNPRRYRRRR